MARIVIVSQSEDSRTKLYRLLISSGFQVFRSCSSGSELRRALSESEDCVVVMIGFTPENLELLDDLAIENQQFLDQSRIYYEVLGGLLDARASIINNDLNVMMKNMNAIVIAISVPTFFTGVGGMSEFTAMFAGKAPSYLAYPLFFGLMVLLALVIYWLIQRAYSSR